MKRVDGFHFRFAVEKGEVVKIEIKPSPGTIGQVTAVKDQYELEFTKVDDDWVFKFPISESSGGTHLVSIDCQFVGTNPPGAQFDMTLRGSLGGLFDDFVSIKTTTNNKIYEPEFVVE